MAVISSMQWGRISARTRADPRPISTSARTRPPTRPIGPRTVNFMKYQPAKIQRDINLVSHLIRLWLTEFDMQNMQIIYETLKLLIRNFEGFKTCLKIVLLNISFSDTFKTILESVTSLTFVHVFNKYVERQKQDLAKSKSNVPGQDLSWHNWTCVASPVHWCPPYWGTGLSQERARFCTPFPQVTLQRPHVCHALHPPSTDKTNLVPT